MLKVDILTLFPEMFTGPFDHSIVRRATDKSLVEIKIHNLRDWATDKYKSVDDKPYGGGPGMVIRVDVVNAAVTALRSQRTKVILLDAGGKKFNQKKAADLSHDEHLILICGHYEGVDHRVHEHIADEVISIGDYVLSGGEVPAMVVVDTIVRLLPGALGNEQSLIEESHNAGEAEYPQYTRPEEYNGWKVPEILLSGDHAKIKKWRSPAQ
ncbi:MAG: tRNA (guanine-N(1)-)-methyltransferase [Candidatus Amesbacteria bacterium GW2011_GWA2_47_11b]|uniref:tRNA (guanine-N(1)-)-methyltransferase n=3 Tax=Candidatus Amesiibacteriota TaxID=1752730 RepID=A0A0G1VJP8_9BACT|nr:MAG: tRNA (guanine-N(1)-)-methyltransferase [Microgenomates group bacterium GW2011_GWC1_46_20]KKU58224.1 MAG: tRNA (guanine-N(1)-)-methyltransferase [Candidatus Amesbacteria bacterium GW2011_GWA2_47_11b]KKU70300.1 MAG: tRNA (guanine-N(1)-)-methyltransferase [Candidatus Amesbacteria bacterium GW2011_GWA1_47_20]KKU83545.1 MAG: tRNA (guanine-N(1)-)-methyltransferase [Candidatus Amesbacteria bacterium GW2011_GWC2_47_8]